MIVTFTASPSIDRTMRLDSAIERGAVFRAIEVTNEPGGKGVNVARAVAAAGVRAIAVLPADHDDPLVKALVAAGVRPANVPTGVPTKVNITITEPDGTTTKFNDPGDFLTDDVRTAVESRLLANSRKGSWVALSGSLPPDAPTDWYADLTAMLKAAGRRVAVDTSGGPLMAAARGRVRPDLLKPNAEELASLTGDDWRELEADPDRAYAAARQLVDDGIGAVLLTLGAAGAVLVTESGSWAATPPPVEVKSTVGAGDSSLAGYLLADIRSLYPAQRLCNAVAYGAAAAALPGSSLPHPGDLQLDDVVVTELSAPSPRT